MNVVIGGIPSDDQADGRNMQARCVVSVSMPDFDDDNVASFAPSALRTASASSPVSSQSVRSVSE